MKKNLKLLIFLIFITFFKVNSQDLIDHKVSLFDEHKESVKENNDIKDTNLRSLSVVKEERIGFINWIKNHKIFSYVSGALGLIISGAFFRGRSLYKWKNLNEKQIEFVGKLLEFKNNLMSERFGYWDNTGLICPLNIGDQRIKSEELKTDEEKCSVCFELPERFYLCLKTKSKGCGVEGVVCLNCMLEWHQTYRRDLEKYQENLRGPELGTSGNKPLFRYPLVNMEVSKTCSSFFNLIYEFNKNYLIDSKLINVIKNKITFDKQFHKETIYSHPNKVDKFLMNSYEYLDKNKKEIAIKGGITISAIGLIILIRYLYKKWQLSAKQKKEELESEFGLDDEDLDASILDLKGDEESLEDLEYEDL